MCDAARQSSRGILALGIATGFLPDRYFRSCNSRMVFMYVWSDNCVKISVSSNRFSFFSMLFSVFLKFFSIFSEKTHPELSKPRGRHSLAVRLDGATLEPADISIWSEVSSSVVYVSLCFILPRTNWTHSEKHGKMG